MLCIKQVIHLIKEVSYIIIKKRYLENSSQIKTIPCAKNNIFLIVRQILIDSKIKLVTLK